MPSRPSKAGAGAPALHCVLERAGGRRGVPSNEVAALFVGFIDVFGMCVWAWLFVLKK